MKKGQTAMEYLMTYGWAILIVIVVVAALYSMGVFTVSPGVPCSPCFSAFAFVDYADGTLMFRSGPRTIAFFVDNITFIPGNGNEYVGDLDGDGLAECSWNDTATDYCTSGNDITIRNITTTEDVTITINYKDTNSGLWHTDTATIHN